MGGLMWINVNAAFDISLFALILGHRGPGAEGP